MVLKLKTAWRDGTTHLVMSPLALMQRLAALEASAPRVPGGIYGEAANRRTYERLLALAGIALGAGQRVIVDTAFLRMHKRQAFRELARQHGVPFTVLYCHAGSGLLRQRLREAEGPAAGG